MRNFYLVIFIFLAGCASSPELEHNQAQIYDATVMGPASIDESLVLAQKNAIRRLKEDKDVEDSTPKDLGAIEHKYLLNNKLEHPKVQKWIRYYSVKDRERFQRFLNRGAKYKALIQNLLVANDLPPDLYYLAMVESGFVGNAVSHASAVGTWQFMAPTGRQYGLKINSYVDERNDPIRSTLAAVRYLKELYRQKKTWYLALAAYNAGPGRVRGAMRRARRRGRPQNYWSLTQRRLLPYDTREYIPQFLAMLYIGKNLEKFGFVEVMEESLPDMELVKVPSPVKLPMIAKSLDMDVADVRKLNPHLVRDMTPPGKKEYPLWITKPYIAKLKESYDTLASHRIKGLKIRRSIANYRNTYHRVRRGQNLFVIAKRYRTSVSKLKRMNRLRSSKIYVGQKLRVRSRRVQKLFSNQKVAFHRVRRGQNLTSIARQYGMRLSSLRKLNNLRSSRIYHGQKLKVFGSAGTTVVAKKVHKVRRGDNLTKIAKRYGTTVAKLKKRNGLKSGKILRGQKIKVAAKMRRYKIRRGDNLSSIARKFGLTIRQIKRLNKLKSNRILRGQYLIIAAN